MIQVMKSFDNQSLSSEYSNRSSNKYQQQLRSKRSKQKRNNYESDTRHYNNNSAKLNSLIRKIDESNRQQEKSKRQQYLDKAFVSLNKSKSSSSKYNGYSNTYNNYNESSEISSNNLTCSDLDTISNNSYGTDLKFQRKTLIKSILKEDINLLKNILPQHDLLSIKDKHRNTLMHIACGFGRLKSVQLLFKLCPKLIDQVDDKGHNPIDVAIKHGQIDVIKWLFTKTNKLIDDYKSDNYSRRTYLHFAAKHGENEILRFILTEMYKHQLSLDLQDFNGNTAAHLAAKYNHLDCLQTLVEFNCDVTVVNKNGHTPCFVAEFFGNEECVHYLMIVETCINLSIKVVKLSRRLRETKSNNEILKAQMDEAIAINNDFINQRENVMNISLDLMQRQLNQLESKIFSEIDKLQAENQNLNKFIRDLVEDKMMRINKIANQKQGIVKQLLPNSNELNHTEIEIKIENVKHHKRNNQLSNKANNGSNLGINFINDAQDNGRFDTFDANYNEINTDDLKKAQELLNRSTNDFKNRVKTEIIYCREELVNTKENCVQVLKMDQKKLDSVKSRFNQIKCSLDSLENNVKVANGNVANGGGLMSIDHLEIIETKEHLEVLRKMYQEATHKLMIFRNALKQKPVNQPTASSSSVSASLLSRPIEISTTNLQSQYYPASNDYNNHDVDYQLNHHNHHQQLQQAEQHHQSYNQQQQSPSSCPEYSGSVSSASNSDRTDRTSGSSSNSQNHPYSHQSNENREQISFNNVNPIDGSHDFVNVEQIKNSIMPLRMQNNYVPQPTATTTQFVKQSTFPESQERLLDENILIESSEILDSEQLDKIEKSNLADQNKNEAAFIYSSDEEEEEEEEDVDQFENEENVDGDEDELRDENNKSDYLDDANYLDADVDNLLHFDTNKEKGAKKVKQSSNFVGIKQVGEDELEEIDEDYLDADYLQYSIEQDDDDAEDIFDQYEAYKKNKLNRLDNEIEDSRSNENNQSWNNANYQQPYSNGNSNRSNGGDQMMMMMNRRMNVNDVIIEEEEEDLEDQDGEETEKEEDESSNKKSQNETIVIRMNELRSNSAASTSSSSTTRRLSIKNMNNGSLNSTLENNSNENFQINQQQHQQNMTTNRSRTSSQQSNNNMNSISSSNK